jgi:dihydrodipicolinate synthase/N-acetylneuraminate lyase
MAPVELKGIMVALPTPFKENQTSIDRDALDVHINRLIELGVHGLVPGGSTGEFTTLADEERRVLLEQTVTSANGRVPVVAGIGDLSTARTVAHARHAAEAGAAAVMIVPPFYDAVNLEQLREFCSDIHSASGLPIMYYNIPSASGVNLTPAEIATLSNVGVNYLKDTSGNGPALTEMLFSDAFSSKVTAFNGWDTLTFYGLSAGAKGSVWGATNIIPELSVELWKAVAEQCDLEAGREIWKKIFPVCKFLESHNYCSAVKTGMELRGWQTGGVRKPFAILGDTHKSELAQLLKNAGVNVS